MKTSAGAFGSVTRAPWRVAVAGAAVGICAAVSASCDSSGSSTDAAKPNPSQASTTVSAPPTVRLPPRPVRTRFSQLPVTRFDVDLAALPPGAPTLVPWTEFAGNPENGSELRLHVGNHVIPIKTDGHLGEIAVWRSGVVWFEDTRLRFADWAGKVTRIKGVPADYDRLAFGPESVYFVRGHAIWSWSAGQPTPVVEYRVADLAGAEPPIIRASLRGLLGRNDPVVRVTRRVDGEKVSQLYSAARGVVPLPAGWWYSPGPTQVRTNHIGRVWSGYDSRTYRPLWSRTYIDARGKPITALATPLGRNRLLLRFGEADQKALVVDARNGEVLQRLALPSYGLELEGPDHFVYPAYDGQPKPLLDPGDPFAAPWELDWPNVLVRCSLRGSCERVARVEPAARSLVIGTTHLFPGQP